MNAPDARPKSQRSAPTNSPSEIRVAYPYFNEKRTKNSAGVPFVNKTTGQPNPRFSGTFLFPKLHTDPSQCANYLFLWNHAVEAAKKMWPQNVDAAGNWVWPTGAQFAVKDGDVPFVSKPRPGQPVASPEELAKKNAWRKGYWVIEAENFLDPGPCIAKVVNGQVQELPARVLNGVEQYKSGDWGFPNIHAYAYQNETFGINYGFDGFCFTREGKPIGSSGVKSAAQMFGSVPGVSNSPPLAPAAPSGAPALPMQPASVHTAPSAPAAPAPMPTVSAAPSSSPPSVGGPPMPPLPGAAGGPPPLPVGR